MLKSDQGGIERSISVKYSFKPSSVEIRPRWDWKIFPVLLTQCPLYRWNQTKVGLKVGISEGSGRFNESWNQTKVGLKVRFWRITITGLKKCWNQTKVGLKGDFLEKYLLEPYEDGLKSDQGGIESFLSPYSVAGMTLRMLKSDQGGIESLNGLMQFQACGLCWNQTKVGLKGSYTHTIEVADEQVEIRPRWDWKKRKALREDWGKSSWNQTKVGLKDWHMATPCWHLRKVEIRPRWDWKTSIEAVAALLFSLVEIRPRWDWKTMTFSCGDTSSLGWNQTKVGLKGCGQRRSSQPLRVEIRPRWDWKVHWAGIFCVLLLVCWNQTKVGLKDSISLFFFSLIISRLKSDQGGIERRYHRR